MGWGVDHSSAILYLRFGTVYSCHLFESQCAATHYPSIYTWTHFLHNDASGWSSAQEESNRQKIQYKQKEKKNQSKHECETLFTENRETACLLNAIQPRHCGFIFKCQPFWSTSPFIYISRPKTIEIAHTHDVDVDFDVDARYPKTLWYQMVGYPGLRDSH